MNLENLKKIFIDHGCEKIYVKTLAANDLSKSQVYLSGSYNILNIFPLSEVTADTSGSWESERFKANLNFSWITDGGDLCRAPTAKFILYPAYPEVRFSGFLKGCKDAPSKIMNDKIAGRLLLLSVDNIGQTLGYVVSPDSEIAKAVNSESNLTEYGVFRILELKAKIDSQEQLLNELMRIHTLGWIDSKRLHKSGQILPCNSSNCGGYTLEAELGVSANGYSEPDYLGYEIKQFKVANFDKLANEVITLMTPEPTGGIYTQKGVESFIRTYGYPDKKGKVDRINFGGVHRCDVDQPLTGLTMKLIGFDKDTSKIRNTSGSIALIDKHGNEASSWSFTSLLKHWNRKHNQACYVPSKTTKEPVQQYFYGNKIMLGTGTDFQLFLKQMALGNVYYDPGIKMENASKKPAIKRRSQFRIKSGSLNALYHKSETVNLLEI
ncbi:MvaI/BcnI family restriction endonuclease [Mucilaginibacter sp. UYNi724]